MDKIATKSHHRTINTLKQIRASFLLKFFAIVFTYLCTPLMLDYLGEEEYGVWSTILTMLSWALLFDIGIGNGLRNKVSESYAKGKLIDVNEYISTSYVFFFYVILFLICVTLAIVPRISWSTFFNVVSLESETIGIAVCCAFVSYLINMWLSLVNYIAEGKQNSSLAILNQSLSSFLIFISCLLLYFYFKSSIIYMAAGYGCGMLLSNVIVNFFYYSANSSIVPKVTEFKKARLFEILPLGFGFFIIQIAVVVIFSTDKVLISRWFGAANVVEYDILLKLFGLYTIISNIVLVSFRAATSDAYHMNELQWIRNRLNQIIKIFMLALLSLLFFSVCVPYIAKFWLGGNILFEQKMISAFAIFTAVSIWNNIFGFVLAGIGKIRLGMITTTLSAILNIPVSYYFSVALGFGVVGILYGTIASILLSAIISPIQVYYFIYAEPNKTFDSILK